MSTMSDFLEKKISKLEAVRQIRQVTKTKLRDALQTIEGWEGKDTTQETLTKQIIKELDQASYQTIREISRILEIL